MTDRPVRSLRHTLFREQWVTCLALALIVAFDVLFHAGQIG